MKLRFIRHGQTDWNTRGKIQGSRDIELNDTGIQQAIQLGNRVLEEHLNISKIYSSKLKRASKTAEILSNLTKIEYIITEGLEEINFGEWEGLSWAEVKEKFPKEYEEWFINRRYTIPNKGESYQALVERVLVALNKIIQENDDDVAIVTHSAIIMCLQCCLYHTEFDQMTKYYAGNTSIVEIESELVLKLMEQN